MEIREVDNKDPTVAFDLLRVWASASQCCQVGLTETVGCPWESLSQALRRAQQERKRDEEALRVAQENMEATGGQMEGDGGFHQWVDEDTSEESIRARLIEAYSRQTKETMEQIAQAKIEDRLSFFSAYKAKEDVLQHWNWYLHCLSFTVADFRTGGCASDSDVSMPLDTVDLQVIASAYCTQITVLRLLEEPLRIAPPDTCIPRVRQHARLICHKRLWAPLDGPRAPEVEARPLVDALVQLGELQGELEAFSGKTAIIQGYDRDSESYLACRDRLTFSVERSQIKSIVYHEREASLLASGARAARQTALDDAEAVDQKAEEWQKWSNVGPSSGNAPPLRGILDGTLEFQMLAELLRATVRDRLHHLKMDLSGRSTEQMAGGVQRRAAKSLTYFPLPRRRAPALAQQAHGEPQAQAQLALTAPAAASSQPGSHQAQVQQQRQQQQQQQQRQQQQQQQQAQQPRQPRQPAAQPQAQAQPAAPSIIRRMPLQDAIAWMAAGYVVSVVAPLDWTPRGENQLPLHRGSEIFLSKDHEGWVLGSYATDPNRTQGWLPKDQLCIWEVTKAFHPEPEWDSAETSFLRLEARDDIYVMRRHQGDWAGWADGYKGGVKGLMPLAQAEPKLLLSREPERTDGAS